MTITEFLTARLDEREAIAQRAMADWNDQDWVELDGDPLDHIDANDPHAVLADIAAKRRLVELCATWVAEGERHAGGRDLVSIAARTQAITAETVLRALAQPYADYPDFDESWKP